MLNETINALKIKKNGIYLDLTLGRAGHSQAILEKLSDKGMLIAFDKDKQALQESKLRLLKVSTNFKLIHSDFSVGRLFSLELQLNTSLT